MFNTFEEHKLFKTFLNPLKYSHFTKLFYLKKSLKYVRKIYIMTTTQSIINHLNIVMHLATSDQKQPNRMRDQ